MIRWDRSKEPPSEPRTKNDKRTNTRLRRASPRPRLLCWRQAWRRGVMAVEGEWDCLYLCTCWERTVNQAGWCWPGRPSGGGQGSQGRGAPLGSPGDNRRVTPQSGGTVPTAALPAFAHVHCEAAAETVSFHVPDVAKTVEKKTHGRQIFELLVDTLVTRLSRESGQGRSARVLPADRLWAWPQPSQIS